MPTAFGPREAARAKHLGMSPYEFAGYQERLREDYKAMLPSSRFRPRSALGLALIPLAPFTRTMDARRIREQLRWLDNMAANNFDLKEGVRAKLLARLKDLES